MKAHIIDIKVESYPWQVKLLGGVFLFVAFAVMMNQWWLSIILVVAGLVVLFEYSETELDPVAKTFRELNASSASQGIVITDNIVYS